MTPTEPSTGCRVALPFFEGPLPLLLVLIREREIELLDVSLASLAVQYSRQIEEIAPSDLTAAAEDLSTMSTLLHWKSRSLLGEREQDAPAAEEEPASLQWIRKLFLYKKILESVALLSEETSLSEGCFPSGWIPDGKPPGEPAAPVDPGLLEIAFERAAFLIRRIRPSWDLPRDPSPDVTEQARWLSDSLLQLDRPEGVALDELLGEGIGRVVVAVSFLALLELVRSRVIRAEQDEPFGAIRLWRQRGSP